MADFIDGQETISAVGLTTDAINFNPTKYVNAQGNELVAVVRCKDCRKWCICHKSDDFYCADGERKEDV